MTLDYYFLDENNNVIAVDFQTYLKWIKDDKKKIVRQEEVGEWFVSTVFLYFNYRPSRGGPPLVFETMVFKMSDGEEYWSDQYCERYSTYKEALSGHEKVVEIISTKGAAALWEETNGY